MARETPSDADVLRVRRLLEEGHTTAEVASMMGICVETVRRYRRGESRAKAGRSEVVASHSHAPTPTSSLIEQSLARLRQVTNPMIEEPRKEEADSGELALDEMLRRYREGDAMVAELMGGGDGEREG